jgi:hypothetical protein
MVHYKMAAAIMDHHIGFGGAAILFEDCIPFTGDLFPAPPSGQSKKHKRVLKE